MKTVNLGFNSLSDAALEVEAQAIILAMTDNPNFPGNPTELTAAAAATTAYVAALAKSRTGSRADVAFKNEKRTDLITSLVRLGGYVLSVAAGNEAIMVSSGFPLKRSRQPQPPLGTLDVVSVKDGQAPGELVMSIKRLEGARMYQYQYTPDPLNANSQWKGQTSTLSRYTFKSLESGKRYWCRVIAMGLNEQVVYSDPVSRIVQ